MERSDDDPLKLPPELVEHFAAHFDHHDPRFGQDPYPVYRRMREESPIASSHCHGGFWVAYEVDFDRKNIRSLAFAVGPHRCVGSHLARLELQIVHERMHARIPDYCLRAGQFISIHAGNVAGVDALPLVWDPR